MSTVTRLPVVSPPPADLVALDQCLTPELAERLRSRHLAAVETAVRDAAAQLVAAYPTADVEMRIYDVRDLLMACPTRDAELDCYAAAHAFCWTPAGSPASKGVLVAWETGEVTIR